MNGKRPLDQRGRHQCINSDTIVKPRSDKSRHDGADWWRCPACCYVRGLRDGADIQHELDGDYDAAVMRALATVRHIDRHGVRP